jgi:hypothetical protein
MTSEQPTTAEGHAEHPTRSEQFTANGPVSVAVHLVSGDCQVKTSDTTVVRVSATTNGARAAQRLSDTIIDFDPSRAQLVVRSPLRGSGSHRSSRRFDFGNNNDVDIELEIPAGSSLDWHSASGDLVAQGSYQVVEGQTASGDVIVESADSVRARSASGDVAVSSITAGADLKSASGDVAIGSARGDVALDSVSGDIDGGFTGAGKLKAHSVSGDIVVSVAQGFLVTVDAKSLSGDLRSDISLDGEGAGEESAERVDISAMTVSGDVLIRHGASAPNASKLNADHWIQRIARTFTN